MTNILMIDDDKDLTDSLSLFFKKHHLTLVVANDPLVGLDLIEETEPALLLLDVMMPKIDGFTLCKQIREKSALPIIMLTARGKLEDKIHGFELGVDDYLPKPFDPRELDARIHSVLRRYEAKTEAKSESKSDFKCDNSTMVITYKGRNIDLTNAEFGILSYMIAKQGLVVSREDLIHNVNAINEDSSNKSIDVMVGRIRNKLGDKSLIESVRGVGYKLLK